jgi:beta-D-xylosidase 4
LPPPPPSTCACAIRISIISSLNGVACHSDADENVFTLHHYKNHTANQVVADVLRAGTDVDCHQYGPNFVATHAAAALGNGTITEADIDARLRMQYRMRLRLGHFDTESPLDAIQENKTVCTEEAIATSMQGAVQSCALFKNRGGTLPLSSAKVGKIAVIGPLTNFSEADTGYYGPHDCCGRNYWNVIDAVAKYSPAQQPIVSALGVPTAASNDTSGIAAAVQMAGAADTVVLAIGTDLSWAAEGHDALSITFSDAQLELVAKTAAAAKQPVVVVLLTATPLDLTPLLSNDKVGAVLHTGQLSVTMLGVAELLYGKVSPAGRAVQTFYPEAYQDQISIFDFNLRPVRKRLSVDAISEV